MRASLTLATNPYGTRPPNEVLTGAKKNTLTKNAECGNFALGNWTLLSSVYPSRQSGFFVPKAQLSFRRDVGKYNRRKLNTLTLSLVEVSNSRHQWTFGHVSFGATLNHKRNDMRKALIAPSRTFTLNYIVNHEPRVADVELASALGLKRHREIRDVIIKNKDELETYGSLAVTTRKSRGQEYSEFWLNEAQALLLCMFSRTEKAAEVRKQVLDVYMAYRKGELMHNPHVPFDSKPSQIKHLLACRSGINKKLAGLGYTEVAKNKQTHHLPSNEAGIAHNETPITWRMLFEVVVSANQMQKDLKLSSLETLVDIVKSQEKYNRGNISSVNPNNYPLNQVGGIQ